MASPQMTPRAQSELLNCLLQVSNRKFSIARNTTCDLRSVLLVLCVLCGSFLSAASLLASPQEIVPVDGEAFAGELVSIDASGRVTFRIHQADAANDSATTASETRTMRLDELVRYGNPVAARAQSIVVLADGGQLVTAADWSGGAAMRLVGEEVIVLSDTFDEVRLPRSLVSGFVLAQRQHPDDRARLVEQARSADGQTDLVWLTNQDRLSGNIVDLARGSLTIETNGESAKLPLSRVDMVALADNGQPSAVGRQARNLIVGLRDGSLFYANSVRANENELNLELADGVKLKGGRVDDVVALQSLDGHFDYLSDIEAADYRHVPYLKIEWPFKQDRSVLGNPLVVGRKRYLTGIGMHSASRLTYRLDGKYRRFDAAVAVDDSAGQRGSVTFGVYVLRDRAWQEVFKSSVIRGGDPPTPISVDVNGADGLTITVDYADRGDELDRADWLDARLTKN
jgi:hypothetical protein